jgi:hypothetical protein
VSAAKQRNYILRYAVVIPTVFENSEAKLKNFRRQHVMVEIRIQTQKHVFLFELYKFVLSEVVTTPEQNFYRDYVKNTESLFITFLDIKR